MTNEAKDQVPEWAQEAAAKIAAEAIELHTDQEIEGLSQEIARALLSAYRRGRESIADMADSYADVSDVKAIHSQSDRENAEHRIEEKTLRAFAAAIRRLGEAE